MDPRLEKLQLELTAAIAGISSHELRWHPPGKWCAAEVLEHLYLTYTGTIKGFERVLAAGAPRVTPPTFKQRVGAVIVLGFGHLPAGREAPKMSRPKGLPTEQVLAEIGVKIADMDGMLARCEDEMGRGELLDHPILGPLTAGGWRKFHLVHGRHHLKQIRRLREGARKARRPSDTSRRRAPLRS